MYKYWLQSQSLRERGPTRLHRTNRHASSIGGPPATSNSCNRTTFEVRILGDRRIQAMRPLALLVSQVSALFAPMPKKRAGEKMAMRTSCLAYSGSPMRIHRLIWTRKLAIGHGYTVRTTFIELRFHTVLRSLQTSKGVKINGETLPHARTMPTIAAMNCSPLFAWNQQQLHDPDREKW